MKPMLLIVDDEKPTREGLRAALEDQYDVWLAEDTKSAMTLLEEQHFAVLLTDFRLPQEDGMKLIARAKSLPKPPICILMTAYGSEELAVDAMKRGADDYIAKGRLQIDELEMRIAKALRHQHLEVENVELRQQLQSKFRIDNIVGESPAMKEVFEVVQQVAPTRATVLLLGESGTGKELIAKALHQLSPRAAAPMVTVHCAALSPTLLESELFGHEKGAFTGAIAQRIGRLELANQGSMFLDEVGDIPLELQPKLLRVLQEREFERLGSARTFRADVRLISATNRDLHAMVEDQRFRSDLFFRLNVFPIQVPSLRDRAEDIPVLVRHFAAEFSRRMGKTIETIPSETMKALCNYRWPGNIRELQNVIERAVILSSGPTLNVPVAELQPRATPASPGDDSSATSTKRNPVRSILTEVDRDQMIRVLKETGGRVGGPRGAAARLGVKRTTFITRMKKLGIDPNIMSRHDGLLADTSDSSDTSLE